jgi:hypothetical protein
MKLTPENVENICDRYLPKKYKLWYPDEGVPYCISIKRYFDERDCKANFQLLIRYLIHNKLSTTNQVEDLLLDYSNKALKTDIYPVEPEFTSTNMEYPILYRKIMMDRFKNNIHLTHCFIVRLSTTQRHLHLFPAKMSYKK